MATYTKTIPDDVTPLLFLVPNALIPKLQIAVTQMDEELATPAQTKERMLARITSMVRYMLQDIDSAAFKANREQYDTITGE